MGLMGWTGWMGWTERRTRGDGADERGWKGFIFVSGPETIKTGAKKTTAPEGLIPNPTPDCSKCDKNDVKWIFTGLEVGFFRVKK